MEDDGIAAGADEINGGDESQQATPHYSLINGAGESHQTTDDSSMIDPHLNSDMNRRYPDEGLVPREEVTVLPYDDSSDHTTREFSADSSSFLTTLSQMEGTSFPSENNSALAPENSDVADVHEKESHGAEQSQNQLPQSCRICGKGLMENSRAMVRFVPDGPHTPDISLHVFCGKTASILSSQPQFEILLKAGLKNKHGIGPDVNFALARTRSAFAQGGEADKDPRRLEKEYYLVKEFEGHLKSVRSVNQNNIPQFGQITGHLSTQPAPPTPAHFFTDIPAANSPSNTGKPSVHKASTNYSISKNPFKYTQQHEIDWARGRDPPVCPVTFGRDGAHASAYRASGPAGQGRVRCPCGGMYNPTKGEGSWKAHVKTKRHTLWESRTPSSLLPTGATLYKDTHNALSLPTSDLNRGSNTLFRLRHIDEDQGNFAVAHTQSSEDQGDYDLHASENKGNHAIEQPLNSEDQGNYTAAMPYNANGEGQYTVTRQHIDEKQGARSNEHHFSGAPSMLDGRDISSKQDEAAE